MHWIRVASSRRESRESGPPAIAGRPRERSIAQLGWTRGEARALLEKRTDLQAAYIAVVVRNGLLEMPPCRPTQISDAELR
jgi:hypothetical protein